MSSAGLAVAPQSRPARWKADLTLVVVALIWGSTFVVVKDAVTHVSTMYFLAMRFSLASLCLLPLIAPVFRNAGRTVVWRGVRGGFLVGVPLWLGYVFQTAGLQYTTAGNSGFLTGLYVVLVPLLSALIYRRAPRLVELLGIAIASGGMAVLAVSSLDRHLRVNRGDALTVACAFCFAAHLLLLGYFSQRERFEAVALGQIVCAALLSALSLFFQPPRAVWTPGAVSAVVITAVFATALTFSLQTWSQQYTSPTRVALILALEPLFALLTAVGVAEEALTAYSLIGGALILSGILLVELKPQRAI